MEAILKIFGFRLF